MATEADTCRTLITPKLQAAGWDSEPRSIAGQPHFTDNRAGRVASGGNALKRLQAETAAELDALFPAILDRAFKGEL